MRQVGSQREELWNLYAINSNGTLKWSYGTGDLSSPAIGDDGTVYFGSETCSRK